MSNPGPDLFRKESLERLSSPERLDELMQVVSPRAWLPLTTIGSLLVIALAWSVFGKIPITVSGNGVLIQPRKIVQLQSVTQGQVLELFIRSNSEVKQGQIIATVDQSALKKQLEQEQQRLAQMQGQNLQTNQSQRQRIALERQNLAEQRMNIEQALSREKISLDLRQKSYDSLLTLRRNYQKNLEEYPQTIRDAEATTYRALEAKEKSLREQIKQYEDLLPKLKERSEKLKFLLDKKYITADVQLSAEKDYYTSLNQKSDLETQLKQLALDRVNAKQTQLDNKDKFRNLEGQIKDTDVRLLTVEKEYRQSLNTIDDAKTKLQNIQVEEAKLIEQEKATLFDKTNNINEVKRRIAQLKKDIEDKSKITSPYNGKVLEVGVVAGGVINAGSRVASVETTRTDVPLTGIAYFPDRDGRKIKPGMEVQVTPSMIKRERYGGILGKVTEVSSFPVTNQDITAVVGSTELAQGLGGQEPKIQILTQLEADPSNTNNGYKWSSSKGPQIQLKTGTVVQVRIKVDDQRPISYVIPILRSLTGIN